MGREEKERLTLEVGVELGQAEGVMRGEGEEKGEGVGKASVMVGVGDGKGVREEEGQEVCD